MKKKPTGIDLFAGAGGFSLGMTKAGFDVRVAVEIDKWAAETYRFNHKNTTLMEEDITKITPKRLMDTARLKKRELGILFGSPPCQGFSTISKTRSINNPRSKLMHEFVRMVRGVQSKIFYIENVPGLFYFKDFFICLMKTLGGCGYTVRCLMMDACSYGVPQRRKRIFIQGVRKDLNILPIFPRPTHFDPRQLRVRKKMFTPATIAVECFATNGFPKEEVKDLYWNEILGIQMNRKTAAYTVEVAIGKLIGEGIKKHVACATKKEVPYGAEAKRICRNA